MRGVFKTIGVEIDERDVQGRSSLERKERTIVKFLNRKDCLQILRVKKKLKSFDPTELDSPENTKILLMKVYVLVTDVSGINAKN